MLLKFISAAYYTRWTNTPMVGTGTTVRMMNISGQRVAQLLCRLPAGIAKLIRDGERSARKQQMQQYLVASPCQQKKVKAAERLAVHFAARAAGCGP
jgi:hypothetical protein